jgi:hypothetical protein
LLTFSIQAAETAAAVARAVAEDNAKACAVFFSGATGSSAADINGLFDPTEEKSSDGRVLYKKRGNGSRIIEHFEGKWQMKSATSKGKNSCCASVGGGCALEACVAAVWNVLDSGKWGNQTNVKMWTGAEAEAQASCLNARMHPRKSPPALLRSHAVL